MRSDLAHVLRSVHAQVTGILQRDRVVVAVRDILKVRDCGPRDRAEVKTFGEERWERWCGRYHGVRDTVDV